MRVITGTARGRKLLSPEGRDVRPTTEVTKEAIFSIIQFELEGARVLDLFAGSGQLGIEALSRGARSCTFVDAARASQELVRKNLESTGLGAGARVVPMDYMAFLNSTQETFDIALLDPPYGRKMIDAALPVLAGKMSESGVILCETDRREELPAAAGDFSVYRVYRYGKSLLTVYRRGEA
ncbi:MAG: 16S rRNA (guanine(966)-N(2))-methyltransferase RsmD [Clostridiales bacterium]|nr:16S rRNA (guanine(966)-N(2))-methyltransferase RsmD [Clostridiales bacterium]